MSLGGGRFFDPMGCAAANPSRAAGVANLRSIGIASVAPSGNDGYLNAVAAPACLPGVITVGSTSKSDVLSAFTNRWTYPIMAPGEGIFSSVPGGLYATKSGTSAAAAHVAGAIAVLKQALPSASAGKIFVALSMSGKGISEPGNPLPQGFRLNVNAARINILTSGSDVPGVPGRPAAVVSGGSVALSWAAPASGGAPTSYTVEAGTYSGGSNIGSFNLGNVTSITASPGPGVYYIRVRAANNYGVSDASAETTFSIGGGCVPGTPTNLAATVAGNTVTITWRPPSYGGAPSHYLLLAGTSPGSANLGSFNVGSTTTYTATPRPGTYYIRVVAVNAAGAGFSSTETWFTVGTTGAPGQPGTPVATVSGGSVTLTWDAPTTGGVATSYVLVVGWSSRSSNIGVFSMGPSRTVSATPAAGTYYVRAVAVNGSGQSPPSGEIAFSIGTPTTGNIDGTWNGQTNTGASVAVVVSGGVIAQILAGGVLSSSCTRHTNDRDLAVPISGGSFTHTVAASSEHDGYTLSGTFNGSALSGTLTYTALLPGCSTGTATWTAANSGPGQPILPLEPTALNAAVGAGQVNLTWSAPGVNPPSTIAGPTMSYDIEVGTSSGASNIGVFASTETGYTVTNLATGTYYARVKARNASGTGRPSNEVSFAVSSTAPSYTGTWMGTTDQGETITFTVNGGVIVSLSFGFTITGTGGCTYHSTAVATPDQPVSGNQFNWSVLSGDPTYAITGAFDTAGTASGRIYVTNAFSSGCAGSTFFTWTATKP